MLVTELYVRARELFERGEFVPEDRTARAHRVRDRVRRAAPATRRAVVDRLLTRMSNSYVLSTPEESMAEHADLVERFEGREGEQGPGAIALAIVDVPEYDCVDLAVAARDRPGLFAMISGVLAAEGLNILAARIATSDDGIALDTFRLSRPNGETDPERWERFEEMLGRVLRGEVTADELVQHSMRPWALRRRGRPITTTIDIDNDVSDTYTVIDVTTGDRVGLLFTITSALFRLGVVIHVAKVTTMVTQALDAFYVTDREGRKIDDAEQLRVIRATLQDVVDLPVGQGGA
jgi:[protein-PII] uridylyltransferase